MNYKEEFNLRSENLIKNFSGLSSEDLYEKLMSLGKNDHPLEPHDKTIEAQVLGCQSVMYIKLEIIEGGMKFSFYSDALISSGLAALLIQAYQSLPPATIFTCPPTFLSELNIPHLLTPSRSNGLQSMFRKMQKLASAFIG